MRTPTKPPAKKQVAPLAGRIMSHPKKAAAAAARRIEHDMISPRQLKEADRLLGRIERKGEALLAGADRLLKRVS